MVRNNGRCAENALAPDYQMCLGIPRESLSVYESL